LTCFDLLQRNVGIAFLVVKKINRYRYAIWLGLITLDTDIFSTHLILESLSKTTKCEGRERRYEASTDFAVLIVN
jgi:hypothetical protein